MNAKKILVVVESINVNDSSGSKANVALIQNLHALGYQLKVLHYSLKELYLNNIECISIPERKLNIQYLLSRILRVFTRLTKLNINPFIERVFGFSFTFFNDVKSIEKAILKEVEFEPDLVLTLSKAASFRPHYAMLKISQFHKKWIAYIHDPYPFHYYPRPYNWVEPGYKKKEDFLRKVSEKATFSAFPSKLLKEWMGSYFPNFLKTGIIIPHQLNSYSIENVHLPNYFEPNKFTLLHAGNLMKQRSPEGLIKGFKLFLDQYPFAKDNVRLYLIGNASYHKEMLEKFDTKISEMFVKTENENYETVLFMQQSACVNVILESKSEISPFLPGKFPHCIRANKPILLLAPFYSETRRLLGDDYTYVSETDDSSKICKIISILYQKWIEDKNSLKLNRPDLEDYLATNYLNKKIALMINK